MIHAFPLYIIQCHAQYQGLIERLDRDLHYALVHEGNMKVEDIVNYEEVKQAIATQLESLATIPNR